MFLLDIACNCFHIHQNEDICQLHIHPFPSIFCHNQFSYPYHLLTRSYLHAQLELNFQVPHKVAVFSSHQIHTAGPTFAYFCTAGPTFAYFFLLLFLLFSDQVLSQNLTDPSLTVESSNILLPQNPDFLQFLYLLFCQFLLNLQ